MLRAAASLLLLASTVSLPEAAPVPLPPNYKLVLDTPAVYVYQVHYGPHEHVPEHPHPAFPTIFVYLNDSGPIRFTHSGTPPEITVRPPAHSGAFRVAPALAESHMVDNLGDTPSESLRIEFKHLPPGAVPDVFRGAAPADTPRNLEEVAYKNDAFSIERIVCEPGQTCHALPAPASATVLLVAITPTAVTPADMPPAHMAAGETVQSVQSPLLIRGDNPSQPAQLLRILLTRP